MGRDEGVRERIPRPQDPLISPRNALLFATGFGVVSVVVLAWPAIDPGLSTVYDRTIAFQSGRNSPFSIWGQVGWLDPLEDGLLIVGTGALSLFLAFRPRRKSLVQVAALGTALIIALQLTLQHWFYLYIVWWFPLFLVALATLGTRATEGRPEPGPSAAETSPPVPAG